MPAVSLAPIGNGFQFFDNNGQPLNNGKIYTYAAGTDTPLETYTTIDGNVQNSNPIRTDASGRLANEIWLIQSNAYDFQLTDVDDNILGTYPDLSGINDVGAITFSNVTITESLTVGGDTFVVDADGNVTINVDEGDTFLVTGDGTTIFETPVEFHNTVDMSTATFVDYLNGSITFEDLSPELQNQILSGGSGSSGGSNIASGDGRLSLASGVRVMNQDYTGITTIYYVGGLILQINAGSGTFSAFTIGELSQALSDTIYSPAASAANKIYDIFGWKDTLSVTSMTRVGTTVTVTTSGNHNITTGAVVFIAGANETGYNGYRVLTGGSTNTFTFDIFTAPVSPATGTITAATGRISRGPFWTSDTARGTGAGTTEIELIQNTYVNAEDITNGPAANMGTYLGSIRTDGSNQLKWLLGSIAVGGGEAWFPVYNVSNQVDPGPLVQEDDDTWTYASGTPTSLNASNTNRISILRGLDDNVCQIAAFSQIEPASGTAGYVFIGLDATNNQAPNSLAGSLAGGDINGQVQARYTGTPGLGWHFFQAGQVVGGILATVTYFGKSTGFTPTPAYQTALEGHFMM